MSDKKSSMFILGLFIFLGLSCLGYFLSSSAIKFKEYERTVTVKGLSQKEYPANIVLWPIKFKIVDNNLQNLYKQIENDTKNVVGFLEKNGIKNDEITKYQPAIIDKYADSYSSNNNIRFRYVATRTINVYSKDVKKVREAILKSIILGKKGIVLLENRYENRIDYIFTQLNKIKPAMIEEATTKAREVAQKFAKDSNSKLGKIKKARQGQFIIRDRDNNTPYIKTVRVVSTIEYYLSD